MSWIRAVREKENYGHLKKEISVSSLGMRCLSLKPWYSTWDGQGMNTQHVKHAAPYDFLLTVVVLDEVGQNKFLGREWEEIEMDNMRENEPNTQEQCWSWMCIEIYKTTHTAIKFFLCPAQDILSVLTWSQQVSSLQQIQSFPLSGEGVSSAQLLLSVWDHRID